MRRTTLLLALLLAGCGQAGDASMESAAVEIAPAAPAANAQKAPMPGGGPVSVAPMLAYKHGVDLEVPARALRPLLARHEQACAAAGAAVCQVIAVGSDTVGRDQLTASLELRARPDWLQRFRAGLEGQAKDAGGRVTGTRTETEDLTRAIIDTEARVRAQTTLRDRLERLLAERPGGLEDVLKAETELARVQGELDAARSGLEVMRTRVATSMLTLSYASTSAIASDGTFAPLANAWRDVLRNVVAGFAAILTLASWLLPFALVLSLAFWVVVRLRRRFGWGRKRAASPPGTYPEPTKSSPS